MHRIEVVGDICLRRPRPTQGCRADDDYYYYYYSCSAGRYWVLKRDPTPHTKFAHLVIYICIPSDNEVGMSVAQATAILQLVNTLTV